MEVIKSKSSSSSSAEGKQSRRASLKKAFFQHFRSARVHQKNKSSRNNLLMRAASISKVSSQEGFNVLAHSTSQDDNGVLRMKILVKKEDLERVFELMRNNNNNTNHKKDENGADDEEDEEAFLLIEERLNQLRKKHRRHCSWSPALQTTIPEDIF